LDKELVFSQDRLPHNVTVSPSAIGNTLEFLLRPTRDAETATRFFCKALYPPEDGTPQAQSKQEQEAEPTTSTVILTPLV